MAVLDLKVNKSLLDLKFEGYKLSLDPIPVLKQIVIDGVKSVELRTDDYSYLHTRLSLLMNHLFQDPWSQNSVFYINERNHVLWTSLGQDGRLFPTRHVWEMPLDISCEQANITINFPGADWAVLCSGKSLNVLYTPSRAAGEPWTCCYSINIERNIHCYLMHSVHRFIPGGEQIDCLVAAVEPKANIPEGISFSKDHAFFSVLEWISLTCGQNTQAWTTKRTRKLAGPSFPEYAAIDNSGDAICVASQEEFKVFYDSDGLVKLHKENASQDPQPPKYNYIQTPENITIVFRVPENTKKSDLQINMQSFYLEVLHLGKNVLDGALANCIDVSSSTWILDGERLEIILSKAEVGLMWQELVKGDKSGEELMDPALVAEIHNRLAHLTSDTEVTPSNRVPFNLEQLEECDSASEPLTFQRIDGNEHCETHRINMGGHQLLFCQQTSPEQLPAICLRHDVDGILWQPKNICSEGELEQFKIEHVATFSALGYVLASKQDKKFIFCSPDFSFSLISDCSRHVYLYCQPENLHSAFELRNRKTGESIAHIAKQYVISLEQCDRILGLQVSPQCVFVLSKDTLYAVKVSAK